MESDDEVIKDLVLRRFNAHVSYLIPRLRSDRLREAFAKYACRMTGLLQDGEVETNAFQCTSKIEEEASEMIFEVYKQIHKTTKLKYGGDDRGELMGVEKL